MNKILILKFFIFVISLQFISLCKAQIVSEGSSYVSITGERVKVKYTVEYTEEDQYFLTTYKILNLKSTPIVAIGIRNNVTDKEVMFTVSDLVLKSDSSFSIKYKDNSGLFIVDGNDNDLTINNTTIYNLLFSFNDSTHGFVTLHTLNTGITNRGYVQLDPVSNVKIRDHNYLVNAYLKSIEMQEIRFNQEVREKQLADSFALVDKLRKIEDKRKLYNQFMDMRSSLLVPIADSVQTYLLAESAAWSAKNILSCENFQLTQIISLKIDTLGNLVQALPVSMANTQVANRYQDKVIIELRKLTFPISYKSYDGKNYSVQGTQNYPLNVFSKFSTQKWKYRANLTLIDSNRNAVSPELYADFTDLSLFSKYGKYEIGVCQTVINGNALDTIVSIKKLRTFYQYISASISFYPDSSLFTFRYISADSNAKRVHIPFSVSYIYHGIGMFATFTITLNSFTGRLEQSNIYYKQAAYYEGGLYIGLADHLYLRAGVAYLKNSGRMETSGITSTSPGVIPQKVPVAEVAPIVGLSIFAGIINLQAGYNFELKSSYLSAGLNIWYNR